MNREVVMKKAFGFVGAFFVAALIITSCGGVKADEYGWYHDYAAAKETAKKEHKNMLLFISSLDSDGKSAKLKKEIFDTDDFKNSVAKDYVCINLDFSQNEYAKSQVGPDATEKEKKDAKEIEDRFDKNMRIVTGYNIQETPALFLTTKEGYLISTVVYNETIAKPSDFSTLVAGKADDIKKVTGMVSAIDAASAVEKAKAIDVLYEATEPENRYLLADLIGQFTQLDKNNTTGLAGKYTLASANVTAQNAFMDKKYDVAVTAFVTAAGSDVLSSDEKQQAYYTAAYTMANTGSTDYDKIGQYFQAAYDASPGSAYASQIAQMIDMVKAMKASAATADQSKPQAGTQQTEPEVPQTDNKAAVPEKQ
jgi:thioredoxin-related protein